MEAGVGVAVEVGVGVDAGVTTTLSFNSMRNEMSLPPGRYPLYIQRPFAKVNAVPFTEKLWMALLGMLELENSI